MEYGESREGGGRAGSRDRPWCLATTDQFFYVISGSRYYFPFIVELVRSTALKYCTSHIIKNPRPLRQLPRILLSLFRLNRKAFYLKHVPEGLDAKPPTSIAAHV